MRSENSHITGIILAGGQSRRMGADKGLLEFNGYPLIHYPLKLFTELCDEIIISSNSRSYDFLGLKVVADIYSDSGPMSGILSCLLQASHDTCFVAGCDMPLITARIYELMKKKIGHSYACVPWHEKDQYEPVCGIYSRKIIHDMRSYMENGKFKLPEFFKQIPFAALPLGQVHPPLGDQYFFNVNSPADLTMASRFV